MLDHVVSSIFQLVCLASSIMSVALIIVIVKQNETITRNFFQFLIFLLSIFDFLTWSSAGIYHFYLMFNDPSSQPSFNQMVMSFLWV